MLGSKTIKPWGYELIWAVSDKYVGKVIHIEAGHRLSKQFHKKKVESIYVVDGVLLNYDKDDVVTEYFPGDYLHIKRGQIHRFGAKGDLSTTVIEVSSNELDDVVRIEDDYGR